MDIDKNMLRERASNLPEVTEKMWEEVIIGNREMVEEFLQANKQLSKQTLKQYVSGLKIFFNWIKDNLKNKPLYKITKRDFIKYFGYLQDHNLSSSALKFKKSAVSTMCIYIENIVAEEEEDYTDFRNFTKAIKDIPNNKVYDKVPITKSEYDTIIEYLISNEKYMEACFVAVSFNVGSRKNETLQFKSEIAEYEKKEGKNYVDSHIVMAKGRNMGKPVRYMMNDEAIKYIRLWLEKRPYEHEYIFTTRYNGKYNKVSSSWANDFTTNVLSPFLGRRINVHGFKSSCITNLLEQGIDMKVVSKYIAKHESIETTSLYDLRDDEESKNSIFK